MNALFILWIVLFIAGIVLHIVGTLMHNVPVYVIAVLCILGATGVAIANGALISAITWIVHNNACVILSIIYFVTSCSALYWCASGALIATVFSAFDYSLFVQDASNSSTPLLLGILIPVIICILFSVPTAILCPKATRKARKKNHPYVTTSTVVGLVFEAVEEATVEKPGRIVANDIDWAIIPEDEDDKFVVGQRVLVKGISGVRLICVPDPTEQKEKEKAARKKIREEKKANKIAKTRKFKLDLLSRIQQIQADKEVRIAKIQAEKEVELKKLEQQTTEETTVEENLEENVVEETVQEAETTETVVEETEENSTSSNDSKKHVPFITRFLNMEEDNKANYNALKSELLSWGVKGRLSASGEKFSLHRKTYAKITMSGKGLKIFLALDPEEYQDSKAPLKNSSEKKAYQDIPMMLKIKSPLSVRRAIQLIKEMMEKEGFTQKEVQEKDWAQENVEAYQNNIPQEAEEGEE